MVWQKGCKRLKPANRGAPGTEQLPTPPARDYARTVRKPRFIMAKHPVPGHQLGLGAVKGSPHHSQAGKRGFQYKIDVTLRSDLCTLWYSNKMECCSPPAR